MQIDARLLKKEACNSKSLGVPSEAFGEMLMQITRGAAVKYDWRSASDRDDAASSAALKCLEVLPNARCNWRPSRFFNYFTKITENVCRNVLRSDFRRRAMIGPIKHLWEV